MGLVIGRFRKKKSTHEILKKLNEEIVSIEEFSRNTEIRRKRTIGLFILYAVAIYLILAFVFYLYYHKISTNQKLIYVAPLVGFPFVVFFIKKILTWYYSRTLRKNEKLLVKLKEEKEKILENVMETETYKVAKKILEEFGSDALKKQITRESTPFGVSRTANQTGVRKRIPNAYSPAQYQPPTTSTALYPRSSVPVLQQNRTVQRRSVGFDTSPSVSTPITAMSLIVPPPVKTPREILPVNRSILDKFADYIVGDGPSNRYALICKNCHKHNGMAYKEEFEYLSYECAYCRHFNPARKQRLATPKVEASPTPKTLVFSPDRDVSDSSDSENSDSEPIITEVAEDTGVEKKSEIEKLSDTEREQAEEAKVSDVGRTSEGEEGSDVGRLSVDTESANPAVTATPESDNVMEVDVPSLNEKVLQDEPHN